MFVWHELLTSDAEGAKKFYGGVLGWKTKAFAAGAPGYQIWLAGEKEVGGVMGFTDEMKKAGVSPHWLGHVCVDDVDATIEKAKGLGAKVLKPPMDIPTVGRFCIFADPQGVAVSAYAPQTPGGGPVEEMPAGHFAWNELATTNWEQAFAFYSKLFGWEKDTAVDMGPLGTYQLFKAAGAKNAMGGMYNRSPDMPQSSFLYYVNVPEIDALIAKVKSLGGAVLNGPMEVPGGMRVAQCLDPQGAAIAFVGR
jgi:predicted enzyme related to lactoylglutathione lyase